MSRMHVRSFLSTAKKQLYAARQSSGSAIFVIGNESADLDSIVGSIVYGYIESSTVRALSEHKTVIPITNIPAADLALRPEVTTLLRHADLKPDDLITLDDLAAHPLPPNNTNWTLVDHNVFQGDLGKTYESRVSGVIDHHEDERRVPSDVSPRLIEKAGSCTSHIVNYCRDAWDSTGVLSSNVGAGHGQDDKLIDDFAYTSTWDAQVAKLALGAILIDTINMTDAHKVTDHDRKAVRYLEARIHSSRKLGKDYDRNTFYKEINDAKDDLDGLSLDDILRKDYKQWTENATTLGICASVQPLDYLQQKSQDFIADLEAFSETKGLDLLAVMTASTPQGKFQRELLLFTPDGSKAKECAGRFTSTAKGELQLEDAALASIKEKASPSVQMWNQHNLAASRKQVAPLLRASMR